MDSSEIRRAVERHCAKGKWEVIASNDNLVVLKDTGAGNHGYATGEIVMGKGEAYIEYDGGWKGHKEAIAWFVARTSSV